MRRSILFSALAMATFAANAQTGRSLAFGHWGQVWGTFYFQTTYPNGNVLPTLVTYHVDGTLTGSDGTMFGALPTATIRSSPLHGVWERTGFQSIGGTSFYLIFNATGGLTALGRARSSLQFADDFDSFQGKMFVETLPCTQGPPVSCPDPLDPAAKWVLANPAQPKDGFTVSAVRVARIPAGPLP